MGNKMALIKSIENMNTGVYATYWHIDSIIDQPYSSNKTINMLGWLSEQSKAGGKSAIMALSPTIHNGNYERDMTYAEIYEELKTQDGFFNGATDA
jgi:hypothetical protein